MSEFIITSDQLERLVEGIEHDTGREISRVVARGTELPEVVRCRDCEHARHYHPFYMGKRSSIEEWYCQWHSNAEGASEIEPDGFCAWGVRRADG